MTYAALPSEVRLLAERVLTEKQLEAWRYELGGMGKGGMADRLGISRMAVADRLRGAHNALLKAGIRNREGVWMIDEEEAA